MSCLLNGRPNINTARRLNGSYANKWRRCAILRHLALGYSRQYQMVIAPWRMKKMMCLLTFTALHVVTRVIRLLRRIAAERRLDDGLALLLSHTLISANTNGESTAWRVVVVDMASIPAITLLARHIMLATTGNI